MSDQNQQYLVLTLTAGADSTKTQLIKLRENYKDKTGGSIEGIKKFNVVEFFHIFCKQ